ncbi:hypothetical protein ACFVQB_19825 [Paenibacillus sp. NPDC057886]|uniref:hypothetical protein n=1 Tax=Paenibacillus sp. NPDC057886 TaxID=3346270 RepID=UPI0036C0C0BC
MIVSMKKKLVLAMSTSVLALSFVIAPISAFASTPNPVDRAKIETPVVTPQPVEVDDGTVTTMGFKKSAFVFALKHGGELLEDLLEYLGKKEYADYVKENRLSIANFIEET